MCQDCNNLQKQIAQFRRFIAQSFDALTSERLKAAVVEMEAKKTALHAEQ